MRHSWPEPAVSPGKCEVRGKVWRYQGSTAWYFARLPRRASMQIRVASRATCSAWGSIRVTARIGATEWKTSLFPDSRSGCYLLPLKLEVRRREGIEADTSVRITLQFMNLHR
ncbi:MAG: DUF1905 domain-containing protein [Steroidobacteraceae bacterium]